MLGARETLPPVRNTKSRVDPVAISKPDQDDTPAVAVGSRERGLRDIAFVVWPDADIHARGPARFWIVAVAAAGELLLV